MESTVRQEVLIKNTRKLDLKPKISSEIRGQKRRKETNLGKFIQGWDEQRRHKKTEQETWQVQF